MTKTKKNPKHRQDDPAQSRRFIEKAREIDADEERSRADELLGTLHGKPHEPRLPLKEKRQRST